MHKGEQGQTPAPEIKTGPYWAQLINFFSRKMKINKKTLGDHWVALRNLAGEIG